MDPEIVNIPFYKRPGLLASVIVLVLFMVYYSIMLMIGPVKKLNLIHSEYGFKQDEKNPVDEKILTDSAYLKLFREKVFLQSSTAMAASDSICLTINLRDSSASLQISGVTVHSTDIKNRNVSSILQRENDFAILNMLSTPYTITSDYSTIKKEPLMIKMAPKDTSEYTPDIIPDTADFEPVNFILELENGLRIYVYQDEELRTGDGIRRFGFDLWDRIKTAVSAVIKVVIFRVPEYHPYIKIRINRADAKIIYRAVPYHGLVTVCI